MTEAKKKNIDSKSKEKEEIKFKGKYIEAIGRRKTSIARVRLYKKGSGVIIINNEKIDSYLPKSYLPTIQQAIDLSGESKDFDFSIVVHGGGKSGQAEAIRHGISRSLLKLDSELKPALRAKGWLTRDARRKERKKPGMKKARKAPQWSKR